MAVDAANFVVKLNDSLTDNIDNIPDKLNQQIDKISKCVQITVPTHD